MRNAEATKKRILEAAMAEFSSFGIAGARVDRIAKNASCNKNLIYIYFESKENLFTTVLQKHLTRVYEEISFTPEDLPGYAIRVFDFAMSNPDLIRLMTWFSLEQKADMPTERGAAHNLKLSTLKEAQTSGQLADTFSPGFLLTSIMTLATAWTAANPFGTSINPDGVNNPNGTREEIAKAIELLAKGINNHLT